MSDDRPKEVAADVAGRSGVAAQGKADATAKPISELVAEVRDLAHLVACAGDLIFVDYHEDEIAEAEQSALSALAAGDKLAIALAALLVRLDAEGEVR